MISIRLHYAGAVRKSFVIHTMVYFLIKRPIFHNHINHNMRIHGHMDIHIRIHVRRHHSKHQHQPQPPGRTDSRQQPGRGQPVKIQNIPSSLIEMVVAYQEFHFEC